MPNKDKLIKQGIRYTDKLFNEISKRLEKGVQASDTLEAFLEKTAGYTSGNPLVESGYYDSMLKLILAETNNHKFSRPAQKELVRLTIENRVGDLIVDVGEDIQGSVRDIVKEGFTEKKAPPDIAKDIEARIDSINSTRARAIARTEVKRANTVSNYIVAKERGAIGYYVDCHPEACPICVEYYGEGENAPGNDKGHDNIYPIDDTEHLPPVHPNCRCSATFTRKEPNMEEETDNDDYST
jgi:hypothetical protein